MENENVFGVYNEDEMIVAVHRTEKGAEENAAKWAKLTGIEHYVDEINVHE